MPRFLTLLVLVAPLHGFTIEVDYRYDDFGFFENPEARAAMEAVAARWSRVVDQELLEVDEVDDELDARFAISHPSRGGRYEVSSARSSSSDILRLVGAPRANEYRDGIRIPADTWVLYPGSRNFGGDVIAEGGAAAGGFNAQQTFDNPDGLLNRGFNVGQGSLVLVGGTVSFDRDVVWHFDLASPAPAGTTDFYSVALHEVGHGLGLASEGVPAWANLVEQGGFTGANALAAYEAASGISLPRLEIVESDDFHFQDGLYRAPIFAGGGPNYVGTVGVSGRQSLAMEATIPIGVQSPRIELTTVDVAALKDLNWAVVPNISRVPPRIVFGRNRVVELTVDTDLGLSYTVQTSLDGQEWFDVTPGFEGTGAPVSWSDGAAGSSDPVGASSSQACKFYRIRPD